MVLDTLAEIISPSVNFSSKRVINFLCFNHSNLPKICSTNSASRRRNPVASDFLISFPIYFVWISDYSDIIAIRMTKLFQIILDTSVIVSAIRSKRGASYKLLLQLATDARWQINLSTALLLEYEAKAQEHAAKFGYTPEQIDDFLDFLCSVANEHKIYFRWRPFLPDAGDEFILELAIAAGADYIVTYNKKDFGGASEFGIEVVTPFEFLQILGEIK